LPGDLDRWRGIYEGCSINKLQNGGVILLVFKILKMTKKIQIIRFVGNCIRNTCKIFLMMTSLLWRHLFAEHRLHVYYFFHQ